MAQPQQSAPATLPADFFSKQPDTLPADFDFGKPKESDRRADSEQFNRGKKDPVGRFAQGVYETTLGVPVGIAQTMSRHSPTDLVFGPLGPLMHEGLSSFLQAGKTALDPNAQPKERALAAMSMIPAGGEMAAGITRKALEGDVAGLSGNAVGAAVSMMLGKLAAGKSGAAEAGAKGNLPEIPGAVKTVLGMKWQGKILLKMYDMFRKTGKVPDPPEPFKPGTSKMPNMPKYGGPTEPNYSEPKAMPRRVPATTEPKPAGPSGFPKGKGTGTPYGGAMEEHGGPSYRKVGSPKNRLTAPESSTGKPTTETPAAKGEAASSPQRTQPPGTRQRGGPGAQLKEYQNRAAQAIVKHIKSKGLDPAKSESWVSAAKASGYQASPQILEIARGML